MILNKQYIQHKLTLRDSAKALIPSGPSPWNFITNCVSDMCFRKYVTGWTPTSSQACK